MFCIQNPCFYQMEVRWECQCCHFDKIASVLKLTVMLADSSTQNSFSSFGPKVPLAGQTVAEQKGAWLPMSCQTESTDIQLTLILLDFLFTSKNIIKAELFSGLGHFQGATHTVCWDLLYNPPVVDKIPTLHLFQITSGAWLRHLSWEQSHCGSSHNHKPFQGEVNPSDTGAGP